MLVIIKFGKNIPIILAIVEFFVPDYLLISFKLAYISIQPKFLRNIYRYLLFLFFYCTKFKQFYPLGQWQTASTLFPSGSNTNAP